MRLIAEMNGRKVYSDKPGGIDINNDVITFADGSTCNVRTGAVTNKGTGTISLDNPCEGAGGENEAPKTLTSSHKAIGLSLEQIDVAVDVQVHDGDELEVTLTGPASIVDSIRVQPDGNKLRIVGTRSASSNTTVITSNGISIGSGNVVIGSMSVGGINVDMSGPGIHIRTGLGSNISIGKSASDAVVALVKVPARMPIAIAGCDAVNIGDTNGPLAVTGSGVNNIQAGKVTDLVLSLAGSSDVKVREANGSIQASLSGSSNCNIQSGRSSSVQVNASGSSDFDHRGTAENAMLNASGSADIKMTHVNNRPMIQSSGAADITIDNWR